MIIFSMLCRPLLSSFLAVSLYVTNDLPLKRSQCQRSVVLSVRGPSDARVSHIGERLASCLNVECDATDDEPTPAVIVLHTLDAVHNV